MANVVAFEPTIKWETLAFVFERLCRLARREHLAVSWPWEVPRERELLNGVEIFDAKAGVKSYHLLPLFGERVARYPGFTIFVGQEKGKSSLVFRPHPMGENDEEDLHFSLVAVQVSLGTPQALMVGMGLEAILKDAIVASHDLLEGRKPRPRPEPCFPVIRGTQAHLEFVEDTDRRRKLLQAELRIRQKKERWKKIRA